MTRTEAREARMQREREDRERARRMHERSLKSWPVRLVLGLMDVIREARAR